MGMSAIEKTHPEVNLPWTEPISRISASTPPRRSNAHCFKLETADNQPVDVADIKPCFKEMLNCFYMSQSIGFAASARKIIESICQNKAAGGKNLKEKIEWLLQQGLIDAHVASQAHRIREFGNTIIHGEYRMVSTSEALRYSPLCFIYSFLLLSQYLPGSFRKILNRLDLRRKNALHITFLDICKGIICDKFSLDNCLPSVVLRWT